MQKKRKDRELLRVKNRKFSKTRVHASEGTLRGIGTCKQKLVVIFWHKVVGQKKQNPFLVNILFCHKYENKHYKLSKSLFYPAALNNLPRAKTKAMNTNGSEVIMRAELMCVYLGPLISL